MRTKSRYKRRSYTMQQLEDFTNDMLNHLIGVVQKRDRKHIANAKAHYVAFSRGFRKAFPTEQ